ncbi:MAG: GFA family protein [Limnothrix sp.]
MDNLAEVNLYQGGCHCGAVRFQVLIKEQKTVDCNCSVCMKKGFLHVMVPKADFTLLKGRDFLTTYTFNTHQARHTFCRVCGIHAFYYPRSHPDGVDINLRCLDDDVLDQFEIESFDGQNWEDNISQIT